MPWLCLALFLAGSPAVGRDFVPGQILIRYRKEASTATRSVIESSLRARVLQSFSLVPVQLLELEDPGQLDQALATLRANPAVAYAEPNVTIHAARIPNDPLFGQQWGLRNVGQTGGRTGADIHAPQAWDFTTGNSRLLIGVIDTGIDYTHTDLADNVWTNEIEAQGKNGVDDDGNGLYDDIHGYDFYNGSGVSMDDAGHGSWVSGTIGAIGNNMDGVTGVSWQCLMVSIKVMDSLQNGTVASVLAGIQYASSLNVRVACNSWTQSGFSQSLLDAINAAGAAGMLFVAAVGNEGLDIDANPRYPASYDSPYILTVAATDKSDSLASFSNYGAVTVDVAAPGHEIMTTWFAGGYVSVSGTSLASGFVTGICALALTRYPQLTNLQLKDLVVRSVDRIPALTGRVESGGRVNAATTVANPDVTPPRAITDLAVTSPGSNFMGLTWTAPGDDVDQGRAHHYELRYSQGLITPQSFPSATLAPSPIPGASGSVEHAEVTGLLPATPYYFAIRAVDENNNVAGLSNVVSDSTLGPPHIEIRPASLGQALPAGGSATRTLHITNTGEGTLDFSIPPAQFYGLKSEPAPERGAPDVNPEASPIEGGGAEPTGARSEPGLEGAGVAEPAPVRKGIEPREPGKGLENGGARGPGVESTGGPDAFGYRWTDSSEPSGPRFRWVDQSALPPVALIGDDSTSVPIDMGMQFPFYGRRFGQVVIGTNGYLSFTSREALWDNQPLPSTRGTPNMVAPMWDDFDFGTVRRVYAGKDGDRFVVSWIGVPRFGGIGGAYTFQVLLLSTGEIRFQYLALGTIRNQATVGIQNQTRNVGLTVVHNADYLRDSLAIRIRPVTSWVSVDPPSGRVPAGKSRDVQVRFDAVNLLPASHYAELTITNNDPTRPSPRVPVQLYVVAAPDLAVSPASLDFDTVVVGRTATRYITVTNRGTLWLYVRSIQTGNPALSVTPDSLLLAPDQSRPVTIRYAPTVAAPLSGEISIWSNDPDRARASIPSSGTALQPPEVAVAPESVRVELTTNGNTTRTLRVHNRGGSDLNYRAGVTYDPSSPGPGGLQPLRSGGPDAYGYTWIDSDQAGGPVFQWIDLRSTGALVPMSGDDANSGPLPIGFSFPFYGRTFTSFRVASNGFISLTSGQTASVNLPLPSQAPGAPENLLAVFWDDLSFGGIQRVYSLWDGSQLIIEYYNVPRYREANPNTFEVILRPNGEIIYQYLSMASPHLDSCTVGIQNASRDVGLQVSYNAPYLHSGLAVRFVPPRQFVTVTPLEGVVTPRDSVDLTVRIDATGLLDGDYRATIHLDSDDPDRPSVPVPVRLAVRGAPDLTVTPATLNFGNVFVGFPKTLTLQVENTGTAPLTVTSIEADVSAYRADPTALSITPGHRDTVRVTFDPAAPGSFLSTLRIANNDPDTPVFSVPLAGNGLRAPEIHAASDSLSATLSATDSNRRVVLRDVVIENRGGSNLVWTAAASVTPPQRLLAARDPAGEVWKEGAGAVSSERLDVEPPKGVPEASGPPVLDGTGGPDAFGYRWTDSDEPGAPVFSWVDISATGTRIPFVLDDQNSGPIALPFTFPFYGNGFDSMRVCSNGWLSFTSSDNSYFNTRLPSGGNRVPENLIAAFWDDLDLSVTHGGGRVYFFGDPSRFVISFLDVPHWVEPGMPPPGFYSFQVILHRNGEIDLQYLSIVGMRNSATIGIQDSRKQIGLQVLYNQTYVKDSLRVLVSKNLNWLAPLAIVGVVRPGRRDTLHVRFDASDLDPGDYTGALEIRSNDPNRPLVAIPARLHVVDTSEVSIATNSPPRLPDASREALPKRFDLAWSGAHPARGNARFELSIPERRDVELGIYDVRGAMVRRVVSGPLEPGRHVATWEGTDESGHRVRPGVYFARVVAGSWHATRRLVLLR